MVRTNDNKVNFKVALKNKKIPILTLDEKWHRLFPDYAKTPAIRVLEKRLNHLMKKQGKYVTDIKEMKKLKSKLMDNIVANMGEENEETSRFKIKKQKTNQQLILDINEKIKKAEDVLMNLPYDIRETNEELLIESMKNCYDKLRNSKKDIEQIDLWVKKTREELKEKILLKQEMEMKNTDIYSYMHDMLGAEVTEIFDENINKNKE